MKKVVILDFDGVIFRLFVNYNFDNTKIELISILSKYGQIFTQNNDIFDAFLISENIKINSDKQNAQKSIDKIIKNTEMSSLNSGVLVDGVFEFMEFVKQNNLNLGIASNNCEQCLQKFIKMQKIDQDIKIVGRDPKHIERMKPNTFMLEKLQKEFSCEKQDMVFVGDGINDYICAKNFGIEFIAMTPTDLEKQRFAIGFKNIPKAENFFDLIKILKSEN